MAVGIKTMEQNSGSRQNRCRINNQKAEGIAEKKTDVIAENTKLLTFDEMKEKLADYLLYAQIANLGGISPDGFTNIYTVKRVQLRAANINAYNESKVSWLVPVWVFDVEGKMQHKTGKEITTDNLGPETVVLNTIDGGFIQVQRR